MKTLTLFSLFVLVLSVKILAQADFLLGFADSVKSGILHEQRQLMVYTPYSGVRIKSLKDQNYPVLYVLDGENQFRSVAAIVEHLVNNQVCPPMILVGIINTKRSRDLTPSQVAPANGGIDGSGGGERFISFMEKELIPYIDSSYSTAPYKLLMGHSLGGLMIMQTLVHHKDLFNAYISIDAAIWWDNHKILQESKLALHTEVYQNKSLFITVANRMENGMDTTAVQKDSGEETELIRYNLDLIHYLNQHPLKKLRFNYAYYEKENHATVSFISAYDALRFIFSYYKFPSGVPYRIDNPDLLSLITEHYDHISNQFGYKIIADASLINHFGYRALNSQKFEMAKQMFEWNVLHYPKDANLMDSLGDYYLAVSDKKNAISWYEKALAKTEIAQTRQKLNALLMEKK
jgi:predicted alpha/beta superfamily hydrolase